MRFFLLATATLYGLAQLLSLGLSFMGGTLNSEHGRHNALGILICFGFLWIHRAIQNLRDDLFKATHSNGPVVDN